jgi:hypothetical protein
MGKINIFEKQENGMVGTLEGQKIMIYGGNDTGKSYQSTRLPKPMLLMAEAGGNARNVPKFPLDDWDDFAQIVKQLTSRYEEARKMYQTIIIDTTEMLVSLCEQKVAKIYGVLDVSMVQDAEKGNPNGYSLSRTIFKNQVNLLARHGFTTVFISHDMTDDKYKDPASGAEYPKIMPYGSNKEKGSTKFVRDLCDFVIYTYAQGVDADTGKTIYSKAICKETHDIFARSRYPMMQTYIDEFTAENLTKAITKAIELSAKEEGAGLTSFKVISQKYTKEDYFALLEPYVKKIYEVYPDYLTEQIELQFGANKKVTDATDEQVAQLGALYTILVDFCETRDINV